MDGFIKIPRKAFASELWPTTRLTPFEAYADLVRRAAFHPGTVRIGREQIDLERGELFCYSTTLAESWKWPVTTVKDFVRRLESTGYLARRASGPYTVLSLRSDAVIPPPIAEIEAESERRPTERDASPPPLEPTVDPATLEFPSKKSSKNITKRKNSKNSFSSLYAFEEEKKKEFLDKEFLESDAPEKSKRQFAAAELAKREEEIAFGKFVAAAMSSGRKLRFDSTIMDRLREEFNAEQAAAKPGEQAA